MPDRYTLFYPVLTRRLNYKKTPVGDYYSDYHEYHDEIEEDCQNRCVYCDICLDEMGGEGMQLDHFRPKSIPEFESLGNDPRNLVLSCPKCNRLKWHHWPADISTNATHTGGCGFIDPFKEDLKEYFEIEKTGEIKEIQNPSKYMIELLKLNRMARIQVRRKRFLKAEISRIMEEIENKVVEVQAMLSDRKIPRSKIISGVST